MAYLFITAQIGRARNGTKNVQGLTGNLREALMPIKGASEAMALVDKE